ASRGRCGPFIRLGGVTGSLGLYASSIAQHTSACRRSAATCSTVVAQWSVWCQPARVCQWPGSACCPASRHPAFAGPGVFGG
ncbi:MAG: hypothetical protein LBV34_16425, partial [Nocardiopsaceae bacterium]|nr:hypothetical protein [Nocardiopsaceae bacterium]